MLVAIDPELPKRAPEEPALNLKEAQIRPPEDDAESSGLWGWISVALALVVILLLLVGAVVWVIRWIYGLGSALSIPPALAALVALAVLFGLGSLNSMIGSGKARRLAAHARDIHLLLRRERCPACGYSIANLQAEHDGCVVCSECGAAWNAPEFLAEYPYDKPPPLVDDLPVIVDVRSWQYALHARQKSEEVKRLVVIYRKERVSFWPEPRELVLGSGLISWFIGLALTGAPGKAYVTSIWVGLAILRWFFPEFASGASDAKAAAFIASDDVFRGTCPCCEAELPLQASRFLNARICSACGGAWPPSGLVRVMHSGAPREYREARKST